MLTATVPLPPVRASDGPTRTGRATWRSTARAWPYATRGLPLGLLSGLLALTAVPPGIVVLTSGRDFFGALVASSLIGATVSALAVEDDMGETLSASPISLGRRRLLRLASLVATVAVTWGVVLMVVAVAGSTTSTELPQRSAEVVATAGLALAVAGVAHRGATAAAGPLGAAAAPLAVLTISALAQRFHDLPTLAAPQQHGRWWAVAAVSWAVALWTWRDPARRL